MLYIRNGVLKSKILPQKKLNKIAEYFDVSVDYLLGNTDIKEKPAENLDELQDTAINMYLKLSDEDKKTVDDYVKFLLSKQ